MFWLILIVLQAVCTVTYGTSDDNEVIGHPEIACNTDTIEMQFKTKRQFTGKVYVKGSYNRPECKVDYGSQQGTPIGSIRLNHGACNMDRQRMISPEGMMFSTVLIISFHPLFLTKMDKAYNIKCMYKEASRTVTAALDVDNLPTESISADIKMPTCSYSIRKDQLDGPILRYAKVGDQVVHRWQCDSEEYGVLVHSCFVEDGQGEKQMIIDDKGCHTDHLLLGDPTYVEALNMAYRESFVFKFADRVQVRFQCEMRLCLKDDGGCDGITPPLCLPGANNYLAEDNMPFKTRKRRAATFKPRDTDMFSQTVYVMDEDGDADALQEAFTSRTKGVCISPILFSSLTATLALLAVLSVSSVLFICFRSCYKSKWKNTISNFY